MEPKLQKRVQRYGWDLAVKAYEPLWGPQLLPAQAAMLAAVDLKAGEQVVDIACGTGLVTFSAGWGVGATGSVLGVDISGQMVHAAALRAADRGMTHVGFARMDAEALALADGSFDAALCSLGLMYMPDAEAAVREMRRVLRPGGRVALAVWGERARCGWSPVFPIVDAEVASDVCPLFFRLGAGEALANACAEAGFVAIEAQRISVSLDYPDADTACDAAFVGGPVAMAWSRFDAAARARVRREYLEAIAPYRSGDGYALPGEFVVVSARTPA